MKRCRVKITLSILSSFSLILFLTNSQAIPFAPHASVWGLAGTENQARLDALLPLIGGMNNMLYTDLQGGVGEDDAWYGGLGAGYRQIAGNYPAIYGGYFFVDYNESKHHNHYWVVSPGVEAIFPIWDLRWNGYFPVSKQSHEREFFPSEKGDFSHVEFKGHDQYERLFSRLEDVGPGTDAEIGYTFGPRLHNSQLHVGGYYFNTDHNHPENFDINNNNNHHHPINHVGGGEARFELPINSFWSVDVESSYDNYYHGTVVAGLRFTLGGPPPSVIGLDKRMVDPVTRNLGSLRSGSGIPIVETTQENGLKLQRSNIYFFTSEGGSAFVDQIHSGTIDNPLSKEQLSQTVIDQLPGSANLYLNPGNYSIIGTTGSGKSPNAAINLPFGDSIYGRTFNYKASAKGNLRAQLLGQINLLQGKNTIDSIRLLNSQTDSSGVGSQLIAMNILGASNVLLSNSDIQTYVKEKGDLSPTGKNFATAIYANNAQVTIYGGTIGATSEVTGNNSGLNFANAFGGNSGNIGQSNNFTDSIFTIINSQIQGAAYIHGKNMGSNFGNGVGGNNNGKSADLIGNDFTFIGSDVSGVAFVDGDNGDINTRSINFSAGLGGNDKNGTANFTKNHFTAIWSNISGTSSIDGDNFGFNLSSGIGGNTRLNVTNTNMANLDDNTFILRNGSVGGYAAISGNNYLANLSTGIGGNSSGHADLNMNNFTLTNYLVTGKSYVGKDNTYSSPTVIGGNYSAGIGGNNVTYNAIFNKNYFTIIHSIISGTADVEGNNLVNNYATGFGGNDQGIAGDFTDNIFKVIGSSVNGFALIKGNNVRSNSNKISGYNFATGTGGNNYFGHTDFKGNDFTFSNSHVNGVALVEGDNFAINLGAGVGGNNTSNQSANFTDNVNFAFINSRISGTALVKGKNEIVDLKAGIGGNNYGSGIGGNNVGSGSTDFTNTKLTIVNSIVDGTASVYGDNLFTNFGTGIGGNTQGTNSMVPGNISSSFKNNHITIIHSLVSGTTSTNGDNYSLHASGIGGNAAVGGHADFTGNVINISDYNEIKSTAIVKSNNLYVNSSTGINVNKGNNTVNASNTFVGVLAQVKGENQHDALNEAIGLNAGLAAPTLDTITIADSIVNVIARANGDNVAEGKDPTELGTVKQIHTKFHVVKSRDRLK